jgi:hypothetical protein
LRRFTQVAGALALALGIGGCWAAALQLAPMGLSMAAALGSGVANAAKAAGGAHAHGGAGDEDEVDREERCDELQLDAPSVIEVRKTDDAGAPRWRELRLGGSTDAPQWEVNAGTEKTADGWRPGVNLLAINAGPTLQDSLKSGVANYVAYAPAEPRNSIEQDQLVALVTDFGMSAGTFRWNGRAYQYSVVRQLPCFPASVALK